VLLAFAMFSGKSIVPGSSVSGTITADINDQPWDVALRAILSSRGLVAVENEYGIISIDSIENLSTLEAIEPILTRSYRLSFVTAAEVQATLTPLLSARGSITVSQTTNTVIVSDIARVHRAISGLVGTPQRPALARGASVRGAIIRGPPGPRHREQSSVASQGLDRVHTTRAVRRHIAGHQGDGG